ncbi:hypothetical protein VBZ67_10925 [Campylobacter concisus]
MQNSRTVDLLDSDMSVDEFKEEWAKYALKERFNITLSGEDAKNAVNILKEMNEKGLQDIESVEEEKTTPKRKNLLPSKLKAKTLKLMTLLRMRNSHIYLSFKNLRENEVSMCFVSCKSLKKMAKRFLIKKFKFIFVFSTSRC